MRQQTGEGSAALSAELSSSSLLTGATEVKAGRSGWLIACRRCRELTPVSWSP
jgi:hypothetical protein